MNAKSIVKVNKGINTYSIDLSLLKCSCGAHFKNNKFNDLSWICPHLALAITQNKYSDFKSLISLKQFFPLIEQHSESNTDHNMSKIDEQIVFKGKNYQAKITRSAQCPSTRDHEFIRVSIQGKVYTFWLKGLVWCMNGDMTNLPISESQKQELSIFIINNFSSGFYIDLNELITTEPKNFCEAKVKKNGLKVKATCKDSPDSFQVTINIKNDIDKYRLNLKIKGWEDIKGSKVAFYYPLENRLEIKNENLIIFSNELLKWCNQCYKNIHIKGCFNV